MFVCLFFVLFCFALLIVYRTMNYTAAAPYLEAIYTSYKLARNADPVYVIAPRTTGQINVACLQHANHYGKLLRSCHYAEGKKLKKIKHRRRHHTWSLYIFSRKLRFPMPMPSLTLIRIAHTRTPCSYIASLFVRSGLKVYSPNSLPWAEVQPLRQRIRGTALVGFAVVLFCVRFAENIWKFSKGFPTACTVALQRA